MRALLERSHRTILGAVPSSTTGSPELSIFDLEHVADDVAALASGLRIHAVRSPDDGAEVGLHSMLTYPTYSLDVRSAAGGPPGRGAANKTAGQAFACTAIFPSTPTPSEPCPQVISDGSRCSRVVAIRSRTHYKVR